MKQEDLTHSTCRYPFGHSGGYTFCGEQVAVPGAPYCHKHMARCYIGPDGDRATKKEIDALIGRKTAKRKKWGAVGRTLNLG